MNYYENKAANIYRDGLFSIIRMIQKKTNATATLNNSSAVKEMHEALTIDIQHRMNADFKEIRNLILKGHYEA